MTRPISLNHLCTQEQVWTIARRVYREETRRLPVSRDLRARIEKLLARDYNGWQTYPEWLSHWQQESESIFKEILQNEV